MPRTKAISEQDRMNREFLAALRAGQARLGDRDIDTARLLPGSRSTFCSRKQAPENFGLGDIRILAKRYNFTDYQVCQFIGVKYNGGTVV